MKPSTRMMMISSLGEEDSENRRRMGFQSERERHSPEYGYDRPENGYEPESGYGVRSRDDYERRDPPRGYGRPEGGMSPWRREEAARRLGEDRYRERIDKEEREGGRTDMRRMDYGSRRPMSHYGSEEDEDDMSGSFRHRKAERNVQDEEPEDLTEERVKKWVNGMQNADGKTGPHFHTDQAELLRANYCQHCDKAEFYGAVNMMYSDYCEVAKRLNVDRPEFYACMAKAFLMDKDAGEGKLEKYMRHIAGK